ncbi:MAG: hypothetical protein ACR2OD_06640, partial [Gaiellaceae bacterium]
MGDRVTELCSHVRGERLWAELEELASFRDEGAPPYTRRAFGAAYEEARIWLRGRMEAAGLTTRRDEAGTLIGLRPGGRELPVLATGSHIDTVHAGGRFDGALGVLAAFEALET